MKKIYIIYYFIIICRTGDGWVSPAYHFPQPIASHSSLCLRRQESRLTLAKAKPVRPASDRLVRKKQRVTYTCQRHSCRILSKQALLFPRSVFIRMEREGILRQFEFWFQVRPLRSWSALPSPLPLPPLQIFRGFQRVGPPLPPLSHALLYVYFLCPHFCTLCFFLSFFFLIFLAFNFKKLRLFI